MKYVFVEHMYKVNNHASIWAFKSYHVLKIHSFQWPFWYMFHDCYS